MAVFKNCADSQLVTAAKKTGFVKNNFTCAEKGGKTSFIIIYILSLESEIY